MSERTGGPGAFVDNAFAEPGAVLAKESTWGRDDYIRLLCQGSFPEVLRLTAPAAVTGWFRGYLDTVISRDIKDFAQVHRVQALMDLVALVAANAGSPLVGSRIANDLGIDVTTVRTYLRYLETVFMVASARAWSTNLSSRVTHAPKVFVTDSGLAAYLLDVDPETLQVPGHPALGGLVETFVFSELIKLSTFATRETSVRHYRDRDQREIDLVLERRDGRVVAIEVKATATPKSDDARHLRWLRDRLGDRFVAGYLLHLGSTNLASGERIYVTPLSALWDHTSPRAVKPGRL